MTSQSDLHGLQSPRRHCHGNNVMIGESDWRLEISRPKCRRRIRIGRRLLGSFPQQMDPKIRIFAHFQSRSTTEGKSIVDRFTHAQLALCDLYDCCYKKYCLSQICKCMTIYMSVKGMFLVLFKYISLREIHVFFTFLLRL